MPFFIARYRQSGSTRTDVVPEREAFDTAAAADAAARRRYPPGSYVIMPAESFESVSRQVFRDLGSTTD